RQDLATVKSMGHASAAAANENEACHVARTLPASLEHDLASHRVPDENDRPVAHLAANVIEVVGVGKDVDPIRIARGGRPSVPPIMPVAKIRQGRKVVPQVLPDVPVAADAVAEYRREGRSPLPLTDVE